MYMPLGISTDEPTGNSMNCPNFVWVSIPIGVRQTSKGFVFVVPIGALVSIVCLIWTASSEVFLMVLLGLYVFLYVLMVFSGFLIVVGFSS